MKWIYGWVNHVINIHVHIVSGYRDEYVERREPYQDEINLCNTLINYLQKFQSQTEQEGSVDTMGEEGGAKSSGWSIIKGIVLEDNGFIDHSLNLYLSHT